MIERIRKDLLERMAAIDAAHDYDARHMLYAQFAGWGEVVINDLLLQMELLTEKKNALSATIGPQKKRAVTGYNQ